MKKRVIYLAGLISTDFPESLAWRERVIPQLEAAGFEVRTPLAGKKNLKSESKDGGITSTQTTNRAIVLRDRRDVREADIILANLEVFGCPRPSIGTYCELAWAYDDRTPVVAAVADDNYLLHNHPFLSEFVTKYCATLSDALDFIIKYYGTPPV